jgi:hypothetical protein
MILQNVSVGLRDTIPHFLAVGRCKLEGTMDESVKVCQIEPFPKGA